MRYDDEAGKGDHRHVMGREERYRFVSVTKLRRDFETDVGNYGGANEEVDRSYGRQPVECARSI